MKSIKLAFIVLFPIVHTLIQTIANPLSNKNLMCRDTVTFVPPKQLKVKYVRGTVVSSLIPIEYSDYRMAILCININDDGHSDIIAECEPNLALNIIKAINMGLSITFELIFIKDGGHEITGVDFANSSIEKHYKKQPP